MSFPRSLSELDSLRLTGEAGDKIRQVTERATLFRITSNAMINVRVTSFLIMCITLCVYLPWIEVKVSKVMQKQMKFSQ